MLKKGGNKTLDTQHSHKLTEFQIQQNNISEKQQSLHDINKALEDLSKTALSNLTDVEFQQYISLQDQKQDFEQELRILETASLEVDYYIDNADIIFKYYDIVENGNAVENETFATVTENSILKFFASHKEDTNEEILRRDEDRASLLDRYMEHNDDNYMRSIPNEDSDICPVCESKDRIMLMNDGIMLCNECYTIETVIVDHDKPSYRDPPKEISYFSYKRLNHLNEWISQIQGKESTDIPADVYDRILLEINKQRITNMAEITPAKIKSILKSLKLNKFYEHVPHILLRISGAPTPNFTPEIEEKLRQMFKMIQIPFYRFAPKNRKNFLSYSYTIHKCLQLLELDEYLPYFPLLRSREKTFVMDQIWKKICDELGWEFHSSL
jgi:hypothetical protein